MFHGLLLQKFIYRMVPSLPPKRILKGGEISTNSPQMCALLLCH